MTTLSVLDFRALSHTHSSPKWILEMTHISSSLIRSGEKTVNFLFFPFLFVKIYENTTKKVTNIHEKVTNIHEKLTKIRLSWFFTPLLIKEEEIWVISRIHFGVLWA